MKVVQINATCGVGSTGKICVGISKVLVENKIENYILHSGRTDEYPFGIACSDKGYIKRQALRSKLLGNYGFNSKKSTEKIINEIERISPDIVHLHNIHGHDCNLEMLFTFIKEKDIKLVWTFHDCWAFTGYCTHFTLSNCNKWKSHCYRCIQKQKFSLFFDRSNMLYEKKKQLLDGINLTIVTPSQWLADLVGQSFLKKHKLQVINNGIDITIFKPSGNNLKKKLNLLNNKIVLGVASGWNNSKGLDVFVKLTEKLPKEYKIILVGTDRIIENKLPKEIISINRTQNQKELADIYSTADVFVNPTREDNYPTVNLEAIACGTPVITFRTGGSPEMIDKTCGSVVECDDIKMLEREIIRVCEERPYSLEQCLKKAETFDENERFKEYLKLYERVIFARD